MKISTRIALMVAALCLVVVKLANAGSVLELRAEVSVCQGSFCRQQTFAASALALCETPEGNTLVLSCKHTWQQNGQLLSLTVGGKPSRVITVARDADVSLIEIPGRFANIKPFIIPDTDIESGKSVSVTGYAGGQGFGSSTAQTLIDKKRIGWSQMSGWPRADEEPMLVDRIVPMGYSGGSVSHKVDGEDVLDGIILQTSPEFRATLFVPTSKINAFLGRVVEAKLCCRCWNQAPQRPQNLGIQVIGPLGIIGIGAGVSPPQATRLPDQLPPVPEPEVSRPPVPVVGPTDEQVRVVVTDWLNANASRLRGPQGERGLQGPAGGPGETTDGQVRGVVVDWLNENIGKLRGPAGEKGLPGLRGASGNPTDEQVSGAVEGWMNRHAPTILQGSVAEWLVTNQDKLRGATGKQGRDGPIGPTGKTGQTGTVINVLEMNGNRVKTSPPLKPGSEWHIPLEKIFSEPVEDKTAK